MPQQPNGSLGPYERWLYGPGKAYDLPGLWLDKAPSLSCVAEFNHGVAHPAQAVGALLAAGGQSLIPRLPTLWAGGGGRHFLPVLLCPAAPPQGPNGQGAPLQTPSELAALLAQLGGGAARHLRLNFPVRSETIDPVFPQPQPVQPPAPGVDPDRPLVIVAVIDDGLAFAHLGLRAAGETRMDYCWSQSAVNDGAGAVLFGREFTRQGIEALRQAHHGDEEAIYRAAGLMGRPGLPPMPLARAQAHGAHVLATAAGVEAAGTGGLAPGEAAQIRLIGVDLPATALWDTSGFGTDMFLLAALHYIFDRAERIAQAHGRGPLPLVVNISLGWSGGPHDGSGLIEAALGELIEARRAQAATALVLPSGNMFQDMLSARFTDGDFAPASGGRVEASLRWFAPPGDMTSTFAELWLAEGETPAGMEFDLTAPNGQTTSIGPVPGWRPVRVAGQVVGQLSLDHYRGQRWRVTICLAPTEPKALAPPPNAAAPAGVWRVTVHRPPSRRGAVDLRIQRDEDHAQGHTGARQSRWLDPAYQPYAEDGALGQTDLPVSLVQRFDGLNGFAAAPLPLVVAGHVASLGQAARYSSAGPATGGGFGVDLAAATDRSPALAGVVSAGTRSGSVAAQQGTSSAAPQIARELARAFLAAPPAPGPRADNYLSALVGRPGVVAVGALGPGPAGQLRLGSQRLT